MVAGTVCRRKFSVRCSFDWELPTSNSSSSLPLIFFCGSAYSTGWGVRPDSKFCLLRFSEVPHVTKVLLCQFCLICSCPSRIRQAQEVVNWMKSTKTWRKVVTGCDFHGSPCACTRLCHHSLQRTFAQLMFVFVTVKPASCNYSRTSNF